MIYLDNGATTFPKPECVYETVDRFGRTAAVNAGRGAYRAGREASAMIRQVRQSLLSLCDARGQAEVVFTHSVTVALNQLILGLDWKEGDTAYVSPYEHNAVLRPLQMLKKTKGVRIEELALSPDLRLELDAIAKQFETRPPKLVSLTAISNVTGYVLPTEEVFRLARPYGSFNLLDASQAMGLLRLRFGQLRADAVAFAGHKTLYAPFGIAGFLLREGREKLLREVVTGGNGKNSLSLDMPSYLPEKLESSSLNTVAIAGLQASLEWLKDRDPWREEQPLALRLRKGLEAIPGVTVYGAPEGTEQAGVISFNVEGFRANEVAAILDHRHDIAVRAGHHCAALIHRRLNDAVYDGTVRASIGLFTTEEEIDALLHAVSAIDREALKGISADILRGNC
ncbi:MAG: aminotransferase class V-fold PLP-dependent enzyme [Oscillibacter sp.]|nr:aminotransferase class V-fold PLP-dependent enzyme [Oscillibacter sp.]